MGGGAGGLPVSACAELPTPKAMQRRSSTRRFAAASSSQQLRLPLLLLVVFVCVGHWCVNPGGALADVVAPDGWPKTAVDADDISSSAAHSRRSRSVIKEGQACAAGSAPTPGICATHCRCDGGRWKCCRVRKDYTDMSPAELKAFARTMKAAWAHRAIWPWIRAVILRHETTEVWRVHSTDIVLIWHRLALYLLETLIRKHVDCRFAIPYYDITKYWQHWWAEAPWDAQHLGGDGHGKNCCVSDGPFRAGQWYTFFPQGMAPTCLKRHFNRNFYMSSDKVLSLLFKLHTASRDFGQFEFGLNHAFHDKVHHILGGYMHYGSSINDPAFWVFHSFIDKVFTTWQSRGDAFRLFPFFNDTRVIEQQPPGVNFTYAQMSDSARLPHNARVCYTSSSPDDGEPYFVPSGTPNTTQWRLNKTQTAGELIASMDKKELDQLKQVMYQLARVERSKIWDKTSPTDCVYHQDLEPRLYDLQQRNDKRAKEVAERKKKEEAEKRKEEGGR